MIAGGVTVAVSMVDITPVMTDSTLVGHHCHDFVVK